MRAGARRAAARARAVAAGGRGRETGARVRVHVCRRELARAPGSPADITLGVHELPFRTGGQYELRMTCYLRCGVLYLLPSRCLPSAQYSIFCKRLRTVTVMGKQGRKSRAKRQQKDDRDELPASSARATSGKVITSSETAGIHLPSRS